MSGQPAEPGPDAGPQPYRVRLPGFVDAEDVGLGDVVKRVTARAGVRACGGCARRAAALNRRVVFTRWKPS